MRIHDVSVVSDAINTLLKGEGTVDATEWLANPDNIALMNMDTEDVALFEHGIKDIYSGHYYFKSRGKKAVASAKILLDELFNSCYNIDVVMGLTPLTYLAARWMSRHLGFSSQGVVHVKDKPYEMFVITKKEFNTHE